MKFVTTFKDWWQQRSPKERRLLTIGFIFVVGAIIYEGIVTPLQEKVAEAHTQWQTNRDLLSWMQPRVAAVLGQGVSTAKPIAPSALLATMDSAIKQSELGPNVTEVSQTNKTDVQIRFKAVSFDRLLIWLAKQKEQYNIEVTQLSAQKGASEGIADVVLVLKTKLQ